MNKQKTKSTKGNGNSGRKIAEDRRGLLQVTVWENDRLTVTGNRREMRSYRTVTLKRSYFTDEQWKETKVVLPLSDVLQAARMLEGANDFVFEYLKCQKDAEKQDASQQVEEEEAVDAASA